MLKNELGALFVTDRITLINQIRDAILSDLPRGNKQESESLIA